MDREEACFEAGIKFGSLYHQFAGTPVSAESAPSLEAAMEAAIENQPACEAVTVDVDAERVAADAGPEGYVELTGEYYEATVTVVHEGVEVVAEMELVEGYPLMSLATVESA